MNAASHHRSWSSPHQRSTLTPPRPLAASLDVAMSSVSPTCASTPVRRCTASWLSHAHTRYARSPVHNASLRALRVPAARHHRHTTSTFSMMASATAAGLHLTWSLPPPAASTSYGVCHCATSNLHSWSLPLVRHTTPASPIVASKTPSRRKPRSCRYVRHHTDRRVIARRFLLAPRFDTNCWN